MPSNNYQDILQNGYVEGTLGGSGNYWVPVSAPINFTDLGAYSGTSTDSISPVLGVYDITYDFMTSKPEVATASYGSDSDYYLTTSPQYANYTSLTGETGAIETIFKAPGITADGYSDYFGDVANLVFGSPTGTGTAAIIIGSNNDSGGLFADTHDGTEASGATMRFYQDPTFLTYNVGSYGDVWFNSSFSGGSFWSGTISPGSNQFQLILHELGHSLGLAHPASGSSQALEQFTIMDSNPAHALPGMTGAYLSGLQLDDVLAIQSIYGANFGTRYTDTVYGLGQGFGTTGSTDATKEFIYTIWDGGGTNLIDATIYTGYSTIDLREGHFSSIGYGDSGYGTAANNVAIAYGAVIQNAIASFGASTLIGNQWNNILVGQEGNDLLYSDGNVYTGSQGTGQGADSVGNAIAGSLWQWSSDPNYVAPPTMQSDVLIGGQGQDTFYSGIGNNVLDGGYCEADITAARALLGVSTTWDPSSQITGTNNLMGSGGTSGHALDDLSVVDAGLNIADYSNLHLADSSAGIIVTNAGPDLNSGFPMFKVVKGASGVDGTDILLEFNTIFGTGANDVFSAQPGPSDYIIYEESAGHALYVLSMASDNGGAMGVIDTSGNGNVVLQSSAADQIRTVSWDTTAGTYVTPFGMPGGDNIAGLNTNTTGSGNTVVWLDLTTMAAGTGVHTVIIGGYSFGGEAFASYLDSNRTGVDIAPKDLYEDIYSSGGTGTLTPTPIYDPTTGQITGMTAPDYVTGGEWIDRTLGMEVQHPWVITDFVSSGGIYMAFQTYVDALLMNHPASDVRIVWDGPSTDNLTVYVDSESKSFTVPHFTEGLTIDGLGIWGNLAYDALVGTTTGLSASSPGNYAGTFDSTETLTLGSMSVTYYLETMGFTDGTVWNMQTDDLTFTGNTDWQALYARDGHNDTLVALANHETLNGSDGNNVLVAGPSGLLYNGTGNDTDVFNSGSSPLASPDTVYANASGGADNIIALHSVASADITLQDDTSGNLIITTPSEQITVAGGSYSGSTGVTVGNVQEILLDDTTTISLTGGLHLTATGDWQSLYGINGGGDTLDAGGYAHVSLNAFGGDETLVAGPDGLLYNGTGNDTDVFGTVSSPFSGAATITANASGGTDNVIALHDVASSDLTLQDDTSGNLFLTTPTGEITVAGGSYSSSTGVTVGNIHDIVLDDTTTISFAGGVHFTATSDWQSLYSTVVGGDTLDAGGYAHVTLNAFGGNETLVAGQSGQLYNGTGNDTDVINSGSSPSTASATIYANASGGTGNVIALHDVVSSDVLLSDDTSGNLTIATPTDQVTLAGGSYSGSTGFTVGNVHDIALDDSSTINLTGPLNLTAAGDYQSLYGTGHGDHMAALGNNDTFYGIAGNNTMYGDSYSTNFYAGSGNDVMVGGSGTNNFNAGSGADTFKIEDASSTNTVTGFSVTNGDKLDFADILTSVYDPVHDALANFVQEITSGGDTQFSVDTTGTATFTTPLVTLSGVTGLDDVATLVANGHLIVHS